MERKELSPNGKEERKGSSPAFPVQMHAGGKKLDSLFIDEGFGTLSPDVLEKALDVLGQLSEGNRLVGIISHVDKLGECIPQKLRVTCDEKGSHVKPELS